MTKIKTLKEVIQGRVHRALKGQDYEVTDNGTLFQVVRCATTSLQALADAGLVGRLRDDTIEVYDVCDTKDQLAVAAKRKEAAAAKKAVKVEAKAAQRLAEMRAKYGTPFDELIPEDWGTSSYDEVRAKELRAKYGYTLEETYAVLPEEEQP